MESTKKPRAPRKSKKDTPVGDVVGAFGGAPAIFIEEMEQPPAAPPPAKAKRTKKPAVVAAVTPEGILGSLTATEQRPLIGHLPIQMADLEGDMFTEKTASSEAGEPKAYDPNDLYGTPGVEHPLIDQQQKQLEAPVATRPTLPIYYSEKLMIRFQDANREQRLPDSTDAACFWDCHQFRGPPCVIPMNIEEGIWRVYGNFCCPECAAAYLFHERLDSHVQWERYALLNRLYGGEKSVKLAPARAVLRLFGGTLDITEYRDIVQSKRMRIDVQQPPMISIVQVMDTKPIDFFDVSMKNNFIPWEMDRMNRPGAQGLRLRRTKPVTEKEATLEWCMGIVS